MSNSEKGSLYNDNFIIVVVVHVGGSVVVIVRDCCCCCHGLLLSGIVVVVVTVVVVVVAISRLPLLAINVHLVPAPRISKLATFSNCCCQLLSSLRHGLGEGGAEGQGVF